MSVTALIVVAIYMGARANYHALVPFFAFLTNIAIALFVYNRGMQLKLNKVFALWNTVLALDNLLLFGLYVAPNASFAKLWAQLTGPGYYFIPATSFHFALVFTGSRSTFKKAVLVSTYCLAAIFTVLSFVSPFEKEYVRVGLTYAPKGNILYTSSMAVLLVICTAVLTQVVYAYFKASSRRERSQYAWFFVAGAVALSLGTANYLLSYGVEIYPLSSIAFAAYGVILAYAILRHRFLDIEIIIKRSMVYASLTFLIGGGYAGTMIVARSIFGMASPSTSIPLNAVVIIAIAFLFQPLRTQIQTFVDTKFFRDKHNYRETLRRFSDDIVKIIGTEPLSMQLVSAVTDTMKVEKSSLVLLNQETGIYEQVAEKAFRHSGVFHDVGSRDRADLIITDYVNENPRILDRDILAYTLDSSTPGSEEHNLINLTEAMALQSIEVAVPLVLKDRLRGVFLVGKKLSEKGFSAEDTELLQIIVNQTAVALENSELYDRALSMKRYYDDIAKSMTSGMLTADTEGNVVTLNRAGEAILELEAQQVKGKGVSSIFNGNAEFSDIILAALDPDDKEGIKDRELKLSFAERGEKDIALTASRLRNQNNVTVGVVALFNDMTEKKELERQIERSRRLAYMGEMAANIAHEIKNPIGSIRLFVDALARDFSDPVAQKNFKEVIPQEVEHVDRMVRELLFLARPPSLNKVEHDFAAVVRLTCKFCGEEAALKHVALDVELPDEPVLITADGERLKQALRNIVLNAIEAAPPDTGKVLVRVVEKKNEIETTIVDNGPGMEQNTVSRLFHPFFTTKHGGTGLGLAIANKIVEDHGGRISAKSDAAVGTEFTVALPKR